MNTSAQIPGDGSKLPLRKVLCRLLAIALMMGGASSASGSLLVFTDQSPQSLSDASGGAGAHTPATSTSNLSVSVPAAFGNVQDLDVRVSVNHPNMRQLRVILEAPDGATATLLENGITATGTFIIGAESASGANLENTVFDADTHRSIVDGDSPYLSRFQALELGSIERRTPADASGTWRLRITDYRAGDTGTLVT